jgi:putative DNA primase/helicase
MEKEKFKRQMAEHGLDPGEIIPDGAIHRFSTWGDAAGEMSGAYWHNGRVGWFQDWRTMEKPETVRGAISKADQEALKGSFSGSNNKVSRKALEAGIRRIWNAGTESDGHPYLKQKGITALSGRIKQHEGCLIIPVFGINGELNGLQRIDAEGRKRFLAGTRKKGSFFSIPGNGTYLICEGFATGVSLHKATGASIAVAFDAGNLSNIAKAISKKVDHRNVIIAGDNDSWKSEVGQKNVGADIAKKAAQEIGARCVLPKFQRSDGKKTTDFNDLHRSEGLETVKKQILSVPPVYEFISLAEISNVEIEDNPVIKGLLGEKESLIISAASGVGKSLISNQIAMVCGNPPECGLWNLFIIPERVTSLIVQSENSMGSINRRVRKKFDANPALKKGARNVFMLKVNDDVRLSGCLTDLSFQSLLVDRLNELEAKLLILDPLVSYHDEDENDNAGMRTVLDCVTSICDQTGASVIICHHFNRQDMTRGAAAIRDWAANFLLLNFEKKAEGSTIFRCVHDKSRNYETQPDFYLERTVNLEFLRCEKPGKQSQQIDAVVTALTTMGGHVDSQTALKNAVMVELNCSEATARRAIDETLKMKKITIIPSKGKGHPNSYKLPD